MEDVSGLKALKFIYFVLFCVWRSRNPSGSLGIRPTIYIYIYISAPRILKAEIFENIFRGEKVQFG